MVDEMKVKDLIVLLNDEDPEAEVLGRVFSPEVTRKDNVVFVC